MEDYMTNTIYCVLLIVVVLLLYSEVLQVSDSL